MNKKENPRKQYSIYLEDELVTELDKIAKRMNCTRSHAMRTLLFFGTDIYNYYERFGIIKVSEILVRTEDAVKNLLSGKSLMLPGMKNS